MEYGISGRSPKYRAVQAGKDESMALFDFWKKKRTEETPQQKAQESYSRGYELYQQQKYREALALFCTAAELGHGEAQFYAG